jgi:trimeric autotransporter adhesin
MLFTFCTPRLRRNALAAAMFTTLCALPHHVSAQICPFDNGGSTLAVDGLILSRYALGITGAPMLANTDIAAANAGTVQDSITSPVHDLRITGNASMTPTDATIMSRKIAGLRGSALTDGLNLGSGSRNTPAAVQSFLLAGCAGTAWVQGGNAFGVPGVIGTTDAQSLTVRSGGSNLSLLFPTTQHGLRLSNVTTPDFSSLNTINGAAINSVASGTMNATIAGGGLVAIAPNPSPNYPNQVTGDSGTIGGGFGNTAATLATIGGGQENQATGSYAVIGGGYQNQASTNSVVSGGAVNRATGQASFVGGGSSNQATNQAAVVTGGTGNVAGGAKAFVGSGQGNTASAETSFVGGGDSNAASGIASSVVSGYRNVARGDYSTAGGYLAQALNSGSFVWADLRFAEFPSTADNQFSVRATGGARFVTAIDAVGTPTRTVTINSNGTLDFGSVTRQAINLWGGSGQYGSGVQAGTHYFRTDGNNPIGNTLGFSWHLGGAHTDAANSPGVSGMELMRLSTNGNLQVKGSVSGGVLLNTSDRNVKSLIQSINPQAILAKVAAMPISRWVYTSDQNRSWHLGPMAQDFRAAFGLGQDDKTIATVDAGGVALAAIQGLHQMMKDKDAKISALEKTNALMQKKLAAIERRLGL